MLLACSQEVAWTGREIGAGAVLAQERTEDLLPFLHFMSSGSSGAQGREGGSMTIKSFDLGKWGLSSGFTLALPPG